MKKLLLFLSLLSLIPSIKGQESDPFAFGLGGIVSDYPLSAADLAELINAGYNPITDKFDPSAVAAASAPSDTSGTTEANAILYQYPHQIFNTQNELDQHERDHLLFAGLDIDIDTTVFGEPSFRANQVFASPAPPTHTSATPQGPVINQIITKGSRLDLASSQASAQRNACIICGAIFNQERFLCQHMKKHNKYTPAAFAAPTNPHQKSSKTNPFAHLTHSYQNQSLLPIVDTSQPFELAPIITIDSEQEFAQIAEDARAAAFAAAAAITSQMIYEPKEEENGYDENYSADPENQDNDQPMVSAKNTTDKKSFQCSQCGIKFTESYVCLDHIREIHKGNGYLVQRGPVLLHKCLFAGCTRSFDKSRGLISHQLSEHGTTLYDPNQVLSKKLEPVKKENGLWDCPYQDRNNPSERCPYRDKRLGVIEKHLPVHTGEKNFQCSKCKVFFSQKSGCSKHIIEKHYGKATVLEEIATEEEFAKITEDARKAQEERSQEEKGAADLSATMAMIPSQMITSKEEEEENGDDENYSADPENQYDKVIKIGETTSSTHKCLFPGCKRSLDSKQGLEIHQRRDHGTTLYDPNQVLSKKLEPVKNKNGLWDCPYQDRKNPSEECPYKNKKLYVIKQHLPKHTGEKNFQCSECKVFFTKDCNCLRHIESMHNGDGKVIQLGI